MNPASESVIARLASRGFRARDLLWIFYAVFGAWCLKALWADIQKISWSSLAQHGPLLALSAALPWCNHGLRILRWQQYIKAAKLDFPLAFVAKSYVAGFAFTISPGKIGEMIRARYYAALGVPASTIHGAFVVERVLDLLVMILMALLVLTAVSRYQSFVWVALAIVVSLLLLLSVAPWSSIQQRLPNRSAKSWRPVVDALLSMLISAKVFLAPKVLLPSFILSMACWGAEALGFMLLANGLGAGGLDYPVAAGIYAVAIIVGALSFLPGGLGSTEAVLVALLHAFGNTLPQALLITVVWRFLTLWVAVGAGWWAVFALKGLTDSTQRGRMNAR